MHNSYWLIWNGTHFLSRKWAWAFQITTPLWLAVLLCSTIFYKDREGHKDGKVKSEAKTFWFSPDGWNESPVFINIVFLEINRKMWPRLFYKFLIHRGFISGLGTWSLLQQVSDCYRTEQVLSLHPVSSSSSHSHDLYCIHWSFQQKFEIQMHGSLRISPIMKLSGDHYRLFCAGICGQTWANFSEESCLASQSGNAGLVPTGWLLDQLCFFYCFPVYLPWTCENPFFNKATVFKIVTQTKHILF